MKSLIFTFTIFCILVFCNGMSHKTFQLKEFDISFDYPDYWQETVEDNQTYLFYNERLGSFRFTPIKLANNNFKIQTCLQSEFDDNRMFRPEWLTVDSKKLLYYKQPAKKESDVIIHFFITGNHTLALLTSYAYTSSMDNSPELKEELEPVKKILNSIKL